MLWVTALFENLIKAVDPFLRKGVHTWVCSFASNSSRFTDIVRQFMDLEGRNPDLKRDYGGWIYSMCAMEWGVENASEVISSAVWENCKNRDVCKVSLLRTTVITSYSVPSTLGSSFMVWFSPSSTLLNPLAGEDWINFSEWRTTALDLIHLDIHRHITCDIGLRNMHISSLS